MVLRVTVHNELTFTRVLCVTTQKEHTFTMVLCGTTQNRAYVYCCVVRHY